MSDRSSAVSSEVRHLFSALARAAVEISGGDLCGAFFLLDAHLHFVGAYNFNEDALAAYRRDYPIQAARTSLVASAILDRKIINLDDVTRESAFYSHAGRAHLGYRAVLIVPIVNDGGAFAALGVGKYAAGVFLPESVARTKALAEFAAVALAVLRS